MWLPTPVYERVPDFWVLLALLFFSLALYIGFDFALFPLYVAVGVGCLARGAWISISRFRYRGARKAEAGAAGANQSSEIELDQTGATHI